MDALASLMVELGVDITPMERGFDRAISDAQRHGGRAGDAFAQGLVGAVSSRLPGGLSALVGGVGSLQLGSGLALGAGIGHVALAASSAGAELTGYRRSLLGIAGDSLIAERALRSLQDIAGRSEFDTSQVVGLGIRLAGKSGDVMLAVKQVGGILDAAASFNVAMTDFDEFQKNLSDIQAKGSARAERPDLEQLLRRAPLAITQAARLLNVSNQEAEKKIRSSSGDELIDLIRRIGEKNAGAAEAAAGQTPQGIARNIQGAIRDGLAPTGEILNRALAPVFKIGLGVTEFFRNMNQATGGVGLLSVGLVGAVGALRLAVPPILSLWRGAITLAAEFTALTSAAGRAAMALNFIRPGGTITTPGMVPGTGGILPIAAPGTPLAQRILPALVNGLKAIGPSLVSMGVGMGAGYLGQMVSERGMEEKNAGKMRLGSAIGLAGSLGAAGFTVGMLAGPIGAAIGTAVGTVAGGAIGYFTASVPKELEQAKSATGGAGADRIVNAIKDGTKELKEMKSEMLGGGNRARGMSSQLEMEYSMIGATRGIA